MKWRNFLLFFVFTILLHSCAVKQNESKVQKLIEITFEDVKGLKRSTVISFKEEIESNLTAKLLHRGIKRKLHVKIPYMEFEEQKKRIKVCFDIDGRRFALISFIRGKYIFEQTLKYSLEKIIDDALRLYFSDKPLLFRIYAHNC